MWRFEGLIEGTHWTTPSLSIDNDCVVNTDKPTTDQLNKLSHLVTQKMLSITPICSAIMAL